MSLERMPWFCFQIIIWNQLWFMMDFKTNSNGPAKIWFNQISIEQRRYYIQRKLFMRFNQCSSTDLGLRIYSSSKLALIELNCLRLIRKMHNKCISKIPNAKQIDSRIFEFTSFQSDSNRFKCAGSNAVIIQLEIRNRKKVLKKLNENL